MSDLAYSIRSFAEDLRSELDYRTLCDDEREELRLASKLLTRILTEDNQRDAA
jgi:hypothetical protein